MKSETAAWLDYALENLATGQLALERGYLNACLQNAQQAVEKALKALVLEYDLEFRKTHSIVGLCGILAAGGVEVDLSREECELLDTVYLPSKYPAFSALPDALPERETCLHCLSIGDRVLRYVQEKLRAKPANL